MEISEHSDSTTTPEGQERLVFLRRKAAYIEKKIEAARGYLIDFNNKRVNNVKKQLDEFKAESHKKLKSKMKTFLQKAKMSNDAKTLASKAVEDPRGGITRRYANYTPINRYQYTEDTVHVLYPNASDEFHKKMTEEWKVARKNVLLKHHIAQDMTLCMYLAKFGETSEAIETFKKFRNSECEDKTIQRRFKDLREKFIKKKTVFRVPGCSVTQHEEMNEHSIVKTHKELFCRRCEVYDCGLHGILDFSNFIQPNKYSTREMRASYNEMIILYESPAKRAESKKVICGETCYCAQGSNNNMEVTLKDFVTSKIKLALQIFKFDPCSIRLYFNKDEITCKQIFLYLKSEFAEHPHTAHIEENSLENSHQEIIPYKKGIKKMKNKKDMKYFFPNWKNLKESLSGTIAIDYRPCYHLFYDHATTEEEQHCMNSNCVCFERGLCDKYCGCDLKKCQIRKKGCDCSTSCGTSVCPCYSINTECDPDLCKCCFNVKGRDKTNNCQNQMICFGKTKFCRVGPSDVCSGLGLFTLDRINKGEFVYNYIGELISWEEADFREKRNKYDPEMYLSTVSDEFVVDAKYRGNKARFINHGKEHANLVARNMSSGGLYYFCFFAKCDIEPGSELLFDYEGGGSALKEQFEWITNPRMPKTFTHKEIPRLPPSEAKEVCLTTGLKVFYEPQIQIKIQLKVKKLKKRELINLEDELMEEEDMGYYTAGSDDAQTKKRLKILPEIKQEESKSKSKSKTQSICLSASEEPQDENSENDEILVRKEHKNSTEEEPKYHYIFDIQRESSDEEGEIKEKFFKFLDIKLEKKSESESEAVESDKEHEHILNG